MTIHKSKIIGLTGGIATGKSLVTAVLRAAGHPVICADEIAHTVMRPRTKTYRAIVSVFGRDILQPGGCIDRGKLAAIVFGDAKKRKLLETTVHPEVSREIMRQIRSLAKNRPAVIFLDVPLLFESGMDVLCDATVCVTASRENQLARLKKNRNMPRKEALARIHAQMPLLKKTRHADFVIVNNGTKRQLGSKIRRFLALLRGHWKS